MRRLASATSRAAAIFASALVAAGAGAQAPDPKPEVTHTYEVALFTPLSIPQLEAAVRADGLRIKELVHVFASAEGELTVGHIVDPNDGAALEAAFRGSVATTLEDLARIASGVKDPAPHSYDPTLPLVAAARAEVEEQGLRVTRLILEGPPAAVTSLEAIGTLGGDPAAGAKRPPEAPVEIQATCSSYFVPAKTEVYTGPSLIGSRYASQFFNWDSYNHGVLRACGSSGNITYEQQLITYNYDRLGYFGTRVIAWSSSLPAAYLDSEFLAGRDERGFTIGTSDALQVVAYRVYNTYMRMNNGNHTVDTAKVTGQRGHRTPRWCHVPLTCIWPDATEFITRPASAPWLVRLPGYSGPYWH